MNKKHQDINNYQDKSFFVMHQNTGATIDQCFLVQVYLGMLE